MKKPGAGAKSGKAKASQKRGKGPKNPVSAALENLDSGMLESLRRMMEEVTGAEGAAAALEDAADMFARYLDLCAGEESAPEDQQDLVDDLTLALGELRVAANGGDRQARKDIQSILDQLGEALDAGELGPVDIMMTGKMLADAEWVVPDRLKQALLESAAAEPGSEEVDFTSGLVSTLMELADEIRQNPFELHAYMNSLLASFPSELTARFLFELVGVKQTILAHATAGFVLHRDPEVAQAATETLTAWAKRTPLESLLVERLVRMRPWLAPPRQAKLDGAIRTLRANALPPVESARLKLIKSQLSICDGSGGQGFIATLKEGSRYRVVTTLLKSTGIAEAIVLTDLKKAQVDDLLSQISADIPNMDIDLTASARAFALATARGLAAGALPPFKFIEVAEQLGLGPINPDPASPLEIVEQLLADLPANQTDATAVAKAHGDAFLETLKYQWFETGEALEDLLKPLKTRKQRVAKVIESYLPDRREFWARQCALSALAMRSDKNFEARPWRQLALIGRDIASGKSLEKIPLMKLVAEGAVSSFEAQR